MKQFVILTLVGSTATASLGQTILRYSRDAQGQRYVEEVSSLWTSRNGFQAYDNWRDSTMGGRTRFPAGSSEYATGVDEIGDDLQLRPVSNAIVSDIGWTFWNASATNVITHFEADIRFYNQDRQLVAMDPFEIDLQLIPNGRVLIFSTGFFYAGYHIPASTNMFMSVQFVNVVGAGPSDMGMLVGGPITLGNSTQNLFNFTTGQQIDLGATPQRNLGFFVDVVAAPTPGASITFAAMSVLVLRRRRNTA